MKWIRRQEECISFCMNTLVFLVCIINFDCCTFMFFFVKQKLTEIANGRQKTRLNQNWLRTKVKKTKVRERKVKKKKTTQKISQ